MGGVLQPPVVVVEDIKEALCAEFCKELKKAGTFLRPGAEAGRSRKFKNLGVNSPRHLGVPRLSGSRQDDHP